MTNDFDTADFDQVYFQDLITSFDEHPDWKYSDRNDQSVGEAAEKASEFSSTNEVFIDHAETDGSFYLLVPNAGDPAMAAQGSLKQPLDGTQKRDPYPGSFGEKVMRSYQSIVDEHEAEYLLMDADPVAVLSVNVPLNYNGEGLENSLDAASEVSHEIQEVNDEVNAILEDRI